MNSIGVLAATAAIVTPTVICCKNKQNEPQGERQISIEDNKATFTKETDATGNLVIYLKATDYDDGYRIVKIAKLTVGNQIISDVQFDFASQKITISKNILDSNKGNIIVSATSADQLEVSKEQFLNIYEGFYENGQKLETIITHKDIETFKVLTADSEEPKQFDVTSVKEIVKNNIVENWIYGFYNDGMGGVNYDSQFLGIDKEEVSKRISSSHREEGVWKFKDNIIIWNGYNESKELVKHMSVNSEGYIMSYYNSNDKKGYWLTLKEENTRTAKTKFKLSEKVAESYSFSSSTIEYKNEDEMFGDPEQISPSITLNNLKSASPTKAVAKLSGAELGYNLTAGTETIDIQFYDPDTYFGIPFKNSGEIIIEDITA